MKTLFIFFVFFILFFACKKEIPANQLPGLDVSNGTQTTGPVKTPKVVLASTTKTQFIANADGNGYADLTLSFSSKEPGVSIEQFTFLAYEKDSSDALSISVSPYRDSGIFKPTSNVAPAKAEAILWQPSGDADALSVRLPDDGSPVPVTFTIHYSIPSVSGKAKSGDMVSIQLSAIDYNIDNDHQPPIYEAVLSTPSPQIMITGSKPDLGLNIYDPDTLHLGLTRIMELEYSSIGGSLGINNLPLVIVRTNTKIKDDLVVNDENNHTINTTTIHNGKNYTIQFPAGYMLNGINVHDFFVYAHVTQINGPASIDTYLQPPSKFSWTDIAGGRTIPYTSENKIYYYQYPANEVTTTHN